VEGYRGRTEAKPAWSLPVLSAPTPAITAFVLPAHPPMAKLTAAPDDYSRSHRRELRSLVLFY